MHLITRKLLPLCATLLAGSAQAYSFQMDTFAVWKNFNPAGLTSPTGLLTTPPIFYDNFADLNTPPSAPNFTVLSGGGTASYAMFGSMGPESIIGAQGILTLNSTGAVPNAWGTPLQQAILGTDVTSSTTLGLKQSNTNFVVGGIFNLINPGNSIGSYGVRFTDTGAGNGNDIVSLSVHGDVNGGAVIQFSSFDNTTGVRNVISQQTLASHQQIGLGLTYIDPDGAGAAPKAVYAAYFYLDNDAPTAFINMAGSADLFHGETFTRAALFATATNPVPEPAEYALMLVGLGLVGWAVRRKQH
jgi:hypothetical protein